MDNAQLFFESEQQSQQHHRQYLATVSIDYCIALGREDLLFNLVFPQFFKANEVGVFLERLEPFILGDKIQKLPPEVIKLLLHHYAINKHFRRLEQLILHIPIPLLDFHQVVTLCRKHYLMSALFYIFIQALKDYITPLDDLIQILLKIQSQKQPLTQDQQTVENVTRNEKFFVCFFDQFSNCSVSQSLFLSNSCKKLSVTKCFFISRIVSQESRFPLKFLLIPNVAKVYAMKSFNIFS